MSRQRLLACWGNGDFGRLGHGIKCLSEQVPRVSSALQDTDVVHTACGGAHTAVATDDGVVYTFGLNDAGQLGHSAGEYFIPVPQEVPIPEPVSQVAAGHFFTLCLTEAGAVWAFGRNDKGQLGQGKGLGAAECTPRKIEALNGVRVVQLAAGAHHSLALSDDGRVYSWGCGESGRLGHGKPGFAGLWNRHEWLPRLVRTFAEGGAEGVAAGHMHSGCVGTDGRVWTWGQGRFWQLGMPKDEDVVAPQQVPDLQQVRALAAGGLHTLAVRRGGQVAAWGANQNGVLGLGREGALAARAPSPIPHLRFDQVAAGWKHSAGVASHGRLYSWGWGGSAGAASGFDPQQSCGGQLGLGNDFDYWQPTPVDSLRLGDGREVELRGEGGVAEQTAYRFLQVSCGFNHTAAVVEAPT